MWAVIILACSIHVANAKCTALNALDRVSLWANGYAADSPGSCGDWLRRLKNTSHPKGKYLKFWCESQDRI